ncbi:MAG: type II toxin-antitoxin system RelE/ParE family toxin [Candidatus Gracilibacteria bacterium]|nr:type II toxin-antitoxin system RelE/ParE family toxin [Candidatus Gracilibacteria bacterium]
MELIFKNKKLEDIYNSGISREFSKEIIIKFIQKINILKNIYLINDLRNLRSLNFEKLKNYKYGDYSIRVNKGYRIIFNIIGNEINIIEITELNNHYN